MTCSHEIFAATVDVIRMTDGDEPSAKVNGYMAQVRVRCTQCDKAFQFLGLEPGFDTQGARVSLDGEEACVAVAPVGETPNPLQRMMYGIRRFEV